MQERSSGEEVRKGNGSWVRSGKGKGSMRGSKRRDVNHFCLSEGLCVDIAIGCWQGPPAIRLEDCPGS